MKLTTLCYLSHDDAYLMLHRTKKQNDPNHAKWIGVGGKLEPSESPEDCLIREVQEETGLTLCSARLRGIITFISDEWEDELMFLYTSDDFAGTLTDCDEGELAFIPQGRILTLPLWEGDRIFLQLLMEDAPFFTLKLIYQGDRLTETVLDRSPL